MNRKRAARRVLPLRADNMRIAVIVSRFHEQVSARLLKGAEDCLREHGVAGPLNVFWCPGAFELPQMAGAIAATRRWDAIVCLGAVVRGETAHFEYVAAEAARGIQDVALKHRIPVAFGVLTTDTMKQALERSGGKHGNKGWDAALAALEMASSFQLLRK